MTSILVSDRVADTYAGALARSAPGHALTVLRGRSLEGPPLEEVEIACFSWDVFPARARPFLGAVVRCKQLVWLHSMSAGVDDPFFQGLVERGIRLTTSSGAHATTIAQSAVMLLLALSRDLPGWLDDQRSHRWNPRHFRDLQGRRLLVVGLGPIGLEIGRLGQALGMRVTGLRRTPRGDEGFPVQPLEALDGLLPEADAIALALPLADATHHILDARRIGLLPAHALLVNVGRGGLVDERALIAALEAGRLGGAGLDVFEQEPLPEESPLWEQPNAIVLPHASGSVEENFGRTTEIFLENLARYVRGEALRNEVRRAGSSR